MLSSGSRPQKKKAPPKAKETSFLEGFFGIDPRKVREALNRNTKEKQRLIDKANNR